MSDIFSLSVEDLAAKIRDAQITSVEVCEQYIERIKKFDKDIKAWAHFDKKLLLEKATEADNHRRAGKPLGPLHGIPVAVKDIVGTIDMPTECGTPIRKGKSYSQNAEIVDLLHSAGAIVMGKTTTSELAFWVHQKQQTHMIIVELQGGLRAVQRQQLHLIWHQFQLDLKQEDQ
jgi:Asp-tRNA(Asn)/Glu-tRNA(Gln) amidotransferase A subunit family amidase